MIATISRLCDRLLSLAVPQATAAAAGCVSTSVCTSIPCCGTGPCAKRYNYIICNGGPRIFTGTTCTCAA